MVIFEARGLKDRKIEAIVGVDIRDGCRTSSSPNIWKLELYYIPYRPTGAPLQKSARESERQTGVEYQHMNI